MSNYTLILTVARMKSNRRERSRTYRYDSFGKIIAQTGTLDQPFAFTGREYDAETGL